MNPDILVVVRASPLSHRTQEVLDSIRSHLNSSVRVVVLSARPGQPIDGVELRELDRDWPAQIRNLVVESRCRYFVIASAVDRYLSGAFEAVLQTKTDDGQSIVGRALLNVRDGTAEVGPRPFRFDYFALLSGYAYVAPGAVFIAAERFLDEGGFDRRFSNAAVYDYLLRTGAAHGVSVCDTPVIRTEATPFPGVPPEYSLLYALDCARAALEHHRALLPPGATLALTATLAHHVRPVRDEGYYDARLMSLLKQAADLNQRWWEYVALRSVGSEHGSDDSSRRSASPPFEEPIVPTVKDRLPFNAFGKRWNTAPSEWKDRVRAISPAPVWNVLRRSRRAWEAFRRPLI